MTTCVQRPHVDVPPEPTDGQLTGELTAAGLLALDHDVLDALGEEECLPVPAGQADEQKADMDCAYQPRLLSAEGQHQQLVFTPDKGCSLVLFKLEVRFL